MTAPSIRTMPPQQQWGLAESNPHLIHQWSGLLALASVLSARSKQGTPDGINQRASDPVQPCTFRPLHQPTGLPEAACALRGAPSPQENMEYGAGLFKPYVASRLNTAS